MTLSELEDNTPARYRRYKKENLSPNEWVDGKKGDEADPESIQNLWVSNEILWSEIS